MYTGLMHCLELWKGAKRRETRSERHGRGAASVNDVVEDSGFLFFCGCKRSITVEGQAKEAVCQVFFAKAREGGGNGGRVQESNVGD